MSVSFPATAVDNESARSFNKPSAVSKFWTSVLVAEISLFNAVVNPEMSESFPATAVANESARSFNKPSAVIARDSSSSIFCCNESAAVVNCPNDAS